MKLIFENWRRYLEEEQLEEKLALKKGKMGWWKYSELVAEAYRTAPDYDASVEPLYEKLGHWLEGMFGRMSSKIEIKFVPEHPYKSGKEMRQRVKDEGVMYVSTSDAEHPVWTGEQGLIWNTMFRAWHDWEGHIAKGRGFKLQGEIASYNAHAKTIPRECIPILFTEVVGQICCFYQSGKQNCGQKAMIMPEFDYINVGALTPEGEERFGYRLDPESKLLVPIDNSPAVATSEEGEELNEGVLAKTALALSTALGGVAPEDQDYDTASPDQDQTIQQVDAEAQPEISLDKNEDGSYTMEYSNPDAVQGMSVSTIKIFLKDLGIGAMKSSLEKAGIDSNLFDYSIEGTSNLNKSITIKATPK